MDKIFGYDNFINEVVWYYTGAAAKRDRYARKHDILLWYSRSKEWTFNVDEIRTEYAAATKERFKHYIGNVRQGGDFGSQSLNPKGKHPDDVFTISIVAPSARERIGYPTQKPEALLERIIKASSSKDDVVADFFVGGGTTATVAQRLGRKFIVCDQSRVAIAVTAERLKQSAMTPGIEDAPYPDFTLEQWGIYEAKRLAQMPLEDFRDFVLRSYGATRVGDASHAPDIHGWRNQLPIWVGSPNLNSQSTARDVQDFANSIRRTVQYRDANLRDGIMLAWGFSLEAIEAATNLRQREQIGVNFVRLKQIRIDDADFREHIVRNSTDRADYSEFLTFVQPPVVSVAYRANGGCAVTFDAGDSIVVNPGADIINVQWDFNHDGLRFVATQGYSFQKGPSGDKKPQLQVTHKFANAGKFTVACRVQDSRGGEGMWVGDVEVK